MTTIALLISLFISPTVKPSCEAFTRLDASTVVVCGGSVVSVSSPVVVR